MCRNKIVQLPSCLPRLLRRSVVASTGSDVSGGLGWGVILHLPQNGACELLLCFQVPNLLLPDPTTRLRERQATVLRQSSTSSPACPCVSFTRANTPILTTAEIILVKIPQP